MATTIDIENSSLCGASCIMCPREKVDYLYQVMPFDIFKRSVDECVASGFKDISFCAFGDPLMDNLLEEKLTYMKDNYSDIVLGISTTGQLLKGKTLELVCKYVDIVKISNYGFTKKSYESVHKGSLVYEKIKENIDTFLNKPKRPTTIMTFLDLPENHSDMDIWKNYYEPKVDRIDIWRPHNWQGIIAPPQKSQDDQLQICRRALELSNLIIRTDGKVSMCCFDLNSKLILGDLNNNTLKEILNSEKVKYIQEIHKSRSVLKSNLPCKDCDQIRDRSDALIYTSGDMKVGKYSIFHKD